MSRHRNNFASGIRRPQTRAGAFTLIELVLAMMMVAALAGTLFLNLRAAYKAQDSAKDDLEPARTADLAMEFVRDDIQNALPASNPQNFTSEFQKLAGTFEGTNSGGITGADGDVTFFSTSDGKLHVDGNGETKEIELTTDQPAGAISKCLVRKCLRNLTNDPLQQPDEEILCRGVISVTFTFFDGSNWNETWDSTEENNEIPAAIQMTLVLDRPTSQGVPRQLKFVRTFQLPCSNVLFDTQVNGGTTQ